MRLCLDCIHRPTMGLAWKGFISLDSRPGAMEEGQKRAMHDQLGLHSIHDCNHSAAPLTDFITPDAFPSKQGAGGCARNIGSAARKPVAEVGRCQMWRPLARLEPREEFVSLFDVCLGGGSPFH